MFRNYITIAVRNLAARKGYAIINLVGLTIGMCSCLLIFHYVSFEKSYDQFQPQSRNIVRLRLDNYQKGQLAWKSAAVYPAIAPTLKKDYPEVENFCRLHDAEMLVTNPATNVKFHETKGYFADTAALSMLGFKMIEGGGAQALYGPDRMVISRTMARKYFGTEHATGKQLMWRAIRGLKAFDITGVFEDYPVNSHLDINYLVSYATLARIVEANGDTSNATETSFGWYDFYAYLQLRPGTDLAAFENKLAGFTNKYINSQKWYVNNNNRSELHVIPISDIHLKSNYNQEAEVNGNGQAVYFLFLIAIFIIGIAWVNYINLATARSVERAREVGVRKVLGAVRSDLIRQFMIESFLLNIISLALALVLFYVLRFSFDDFTGRDTVIKNTLSSGYWLVFSFIFVLGTLLSGLYPSFVLSSFQPIRVLKGLFRNSAGGAALRKGLIVVQFVISVVLITGTLVVYRQVRYMMQQDLGANINQTLVVTGVRSVSDSLYKGAYQPFKEELLRQTDIRKVTASSNVMGHEIYWTSGIKRLDRPNETDVTVYYMGIDHDFVPAYELKMEAGRNFSPSFASDAKSVLLNRTAANLLGFLKPEDALNKEVRSGNDTVKVIGIVSDYHHQGLQKAIDPMIFILRPQQRDYYSVKIQTGHVHQTIASVQAIWNKHFPNDPFNYFFLDESFHAQYKADLLFGKVFGSFALLAILIACFGLLGLSAYNVLQRTKEIGIRKVLGASGRNLIMLLSTDFMKLVFIALLLAVPIGWYLMNQWLEDFAYRIQVEWWVFAIAGLVAMLIAFFTIGVQVFQAVRRNPVKSLRTE
jgi:putative ABC transport system permease protein